jgi:hypothetical protein
MILMPFATKTRNSPENLSWTRYYGWSHEYAIHIFSETLVALINGRENGLATFRKNLLQKNSRRPAYKKSPPRYIGAGILVTA